MSTSQGRRVGTHWAVLAAFAVATLAFTWPLVAHLGDAVVAGIDPGMMIWSLWAVAGSVAQGQSPFHTGLLYWPGGADLYLHTNFPALSVPFTPITLGLGPLVAYNLGFLLAFILTGYTMYLLCREVGAGHLGAFLGGFGFDFSAWHSVRLHGHLNLATLYWMPLYLLLLFRLAQTRPGRQQVGAVLLAAGALVLVALSDYQQVLYVVPITALWLFNRLRDPDQTGRRALLGRVAGAWGLTALALSPIVAGLISQQASGDYARPEFAQTVTFSADLLGYVVPYQYNTFVGAWVTPLVNTLWGKLDTERALYLTITLGALGVWGLVREWPRSRVWLNVILISGLLSLGPALHIGSQASVPLPYLLLFLLPGADSVRVPERFGVAVILALAVLASLGFTRIQERIAARGTPTAARRRLAVFTGAVAVLLAAEELAVPQPLMALDVPAFYRQIAAPAGTLPALIEVPIRDEGIYDYYQTIDGHPIVGGYLARDRVDPLIEGGPLIRDLKYLDAGDIVQQDPIIAGQVLLAREQIGYIVVHKDPPLTVQGYLPWTAAQLAQAQMLAGAAGRPVYDDAHLTAYAVQPPPVNRLPTVVLGAGWQPVLTDTVRGRGRWGTTGAPLDVDAAQAVTVTLALTMSGYPDRRPVALVGEGRTLATWDVAGGAPQPFTSPPFALPAGVTALTLRSQAPPGLLPALSPLDHYRIPAILFATALRLATAP